MEYASGLKHEQLRELASAGALDTLTAGGVRETTNGRWQAVLNYTTPDGKRHKITHILDADSRGRQKKGRATATKLMNEWRAQVVADVTKVAGLSVTADSPVLDCAQSFIEAKGNRLKIRASTQTTYQCVLSRIAAAPFAATPLHDLRREQVQAWVDGMCKEYAPRTVRDTYSLFASMCRDKLGKGNAACDGIELPPEDAENPSGKPRQGINALSTEGVAHLNHVLDTKGNRIGATTVLGVRLALHCGLRAEECCGLRWMDVDLEGTNRGNPKLAGVPTIHVRNVINRRRLKEGEPRATLPNGHIQWSTFYPAAPKTKDSRRTIPLNAETVAALKARRAEMAAELMQAAPDGERHSMGGLYVLGDINGGFITTVSLSASWARFARKHQIVGIENRPCSFHDLRHSYGTRCALAGIDVATVAKLMGHHDKKTTLKYYVTTDDEAQVAAVERMAAVFSARPAPVLQMEPRRAAAGE